MIVRRHSLHHHPLIPHVILQSHVSPQEGHLQSETKVDQKSPCLQEWGKLAPPGCVPDRGPTVLCILPTQQVAIQSLLADPDTHATPEGGANPDAEALYVRGA